jgi:hypothetical protein
MELHMVPVRHRYNQPAGSSFDFLEASLFSLLSPYFTVILRVRPKNKEPFAQRTKNHIHSKQNLSKVPAVFAKYSGAEAVMVLQ